MQHIDLKAVLDQTASGLHGNLVTRPTGRAVRTSIEQSLAGSTDERYAVIDFGTVRCLDYSCADEIVAKLLRAHGSGRYFFLRGVSPSHCEAIEHVLERHRLTVIARDRDGRIRVLGPIPDQARRALSALVETGLASREEIDDAREDSSTGQAPLASE
jgi:anti-anti-sigma regulatory factor